MLLSALLESSQAGRMKRQRHGRGRYPTIMLISITSQILVTQSVA